MNNLNNINQKIIHINDNYRHCNLESKNNIININKKILTKIDKN